MALTKDVKEATVIAVEPVSDNEAMLSSSIPTITIMKAFLRDIEKIHNVISRISDPIQLYVVLLYMEKEYAYIHAHNYAELIHLIHPVVYQNDLKEPFTDTNTCVMERLRCPTCKLRLKPKQAFEVHIQNISSRCRSCKEEISLEAMSIATFVEDYRNGRYEKMRNCDVKFSYSSQHNTWNKFLKYLNEILNDEASRVEKSRNNRQLLLNEWQSSLTKMIKIARNNLSKVSIDLIPGTFLC